MPVEDPGVLSLVCDAFGSHRDLRLRPLPRPPIATGRVRIRVAHSTVSFGQTVLISGKYQRRPPLPFVPGTEVAGTVLEVGPGVDHLNVGDRVVAGVDWGGYAEEVLATGATTYTVPVGLDLAVACCLPLTYGTAHAALHWRGRIQPGDTVLVLGAAGGVGLAAVEVARLAGARVIATGSTPAKRELARMHGAHEVLDASPEALRDAVLALTAGRGVDIVFDPVGGALSEEALRCVAPEGRLLVIGFAGGPAPQAAFNVLLVKNVEVIGIWFGLYLGWGRTDERERYAPRMRAMMAELSDACMRGALRPEIAMRFPLRRFVEAFDAVTGRQGMGRVVIDIVENENDGDPRAE